MSFSENVIRGSVIVLVLSFLGAVLAYFIRVLYSRSLSVEDYGLFYAVFGFFSIISVHADLGFGEAIVYFIPKYFKSKKYKKVWNAYTYGQIIQFAVSMIISLILIILAPFLAKNYFKVSGSEYLIYVFCVFLIINSILNSILQIFTGLQKPKYYSLIIVLRSVLVLFFSLTFLAVDLNAPIFYALSWIFGYSIITVVFLYLLWTRHRILSANNLSWDHQIFISIYKYALPAFLTTFIYSLLVSSDIFLLTLLKGVKEVGIYNVVVPIASIPLVLFSPLNSILFPLVSHLYEGEKKKLRYLISKVYEIIPFIGVYFSLFVIMFPSSTIALIFGLKWLDFLEISLSIFSLAYIGVLTSSITGIITLGIGKVKERLRVLTIVAVINICLNIILIWQFGVIGAAITSTFAGFGLCIVFTSIIKKFVDFKIPYQFYLKIFIFSLAFFILIRLIHFSPKNWFEFILSGIIYTVIFAGLGFRLKIYDIKLAKLMLSWKKS